MPRFLIYFPESPQAPKQDLERIRNAKDVSVVEYGHGMVIVEAEEPALRALLADLPAWRIDPGSQVRFPAETPASHVERDQHSVCLGNTD